MRLALAAGALSAVLLAAYLPDLGHGFIKDDFRWIHDGRSESLAELVSLFTANVGFYRPLVSVSFAADYAVWDLNPFGYGLTNLLLLTADAVLLFALARRFALPREAALVAAAVFALNFHGVNMALLWPSGRTSLLALLFALLTVHAALRDWWLAAGIACLGALLSKEESVALAPLLTLFVWLEGRLKPAPTYVLRTASYILRAWPLWAALVAYFWLRLQSGAFAPGDAPDYYRFTTSPAQLLRNVAEYADRAGTLAAAVSLVFVGVAYVGAAFRRPEKGGPVAAFAPGASAPRDAVSYEFSLDERRALLFGALWIPAMFALTVLLPIRSSLYALIPSVGSATIAAAIASRAFRLVPVRALRASAALIAIAALLLPVYRSRNGRWVEPAELSAHVMGAIQATTTSFPAGGTVVLVDAPQSEVSLDDAFGALFPEALTLYAGPMWKGQIVTPGLTAPLDPVTTITFELRGGTLEPVSVQ
jgi:hypothetical protein